MGRDGGGRGSRRRRGGGDDARSHHGIPVIGGVSPPRPRASDGGADGANMIRKRRPLVALALVSLIALVGAGCGSNTSTGTASSGSNTGSGASSGSASNGANTQATKREKAVQQSPRRSARAPLQPSRYRRLRHSRGRSCRALPPSLPERLALRGCADRQRLARPGSLPPVSSRRRARDASPSTVSHRHVCWRPATNSDVIASGRSIAVRMQKHQCQLSLLSSSGRVGVDVGKSDAYEGC